MKLRTIIGGLRGNLYTRGRTLDLPAEAKFAALDHADISLVINLATKVDRDLAVGNIVEYLHVPIADGKYVPAVVPQLAELVAERLDAGDNVLVHCNAGRNRSITVAVLAAGLHLGIAPSNILRNLRRERGTTLANDALEGYINCVSVGWHDKLERWRARGDSATQRDRRLR